MNDRQAIALDFRNEEHAQRVGMLAQERLGLTPVRAARPSAARGAALAVVELDGPGDAARLARWAESGAPVLAASADGGREVLLAAMRAGAQEFVVLPPDETELCAAVNRILARSQGAGRTGRSARVFDVVGVKGGVGATTVAVNLAHALARPHGKAEPPSVVLVDMNTAFGEVPLFLDLDPLYNWGEVVRNLDRLDASYLMGIVSRHPSGLYVLPAPDLQDRPEVTAAALDRMFTVLAETFDFVVVDGGSYLDEVCFNVMALSTRVLLVSSLSLPCLANLRKVSAALTSLGAVDDEDVRVVYNRHLSNAEISVQDAEEIIGRKAFWLVPNDYKEALSAINQGLPLLAAAPKCKAARALSSMAAALADNRLPGHAARSGGLLGLNLFARPAAA
ncbi:MAG: cobyrinic acid a,c-diamide synthase [Desulfovibrionaceae bacterium]|jgi:pilus assembly protein CpaE|nr:cobyrinic acid a,c-diamide synthase [Desulfovibrionaceae bacterium]